MIRFIRFKHRSVFRGQNAEVASARQLLGRRIYMMATNAKNPQEIAGRNGSSNYHYCPPKLVRKDWVLRLICSETRHWGWGTLWFSVCMRSSNLIATRVRQQRFVAFLGSGNSNMFLFSAGSLGEIIQFSDGLKPPTSFLLIVGCHMLMSPADAQWIKTASWWCDKKTPFEILQDLGPNHPYVRIRVCFIGELPSLKLTFSPLKMDGWKMSFLLGWPIFRGYVCFREGIRSNSGWWSETFVYVHPDPWGNDPIWLAHIFQMGWWKTTRWSVIVFFQNDWVVVWNIVSSSPLPGINDPIWRAYCSNRLMKVQTKLLLRCKTCPCWLFPNLSHLEPFWRSWGSWVRPG